MEIVTQAQAGGKDLPFPERGRELYRHDANPKEFTDLADRTGDAATVSDPRSGEDRFSG